MTSLVQVILECDLNLPKCTKTEQVETHTIVVDGTAVELEACGNCWDRTVTKQFAAIVDVGRKPKSGRRKAQQRTTAGGTPPSDIRAWARDNGLDVPSRGRVSAEVRELYAAAH